MTAKEQEPQLQQDSSAQSPLCRSRALKQHPAPCMHNSETLPVWASGCWGISPGLVLPCSVFAESISKQISPAGPGEYWLSNWTPWVILKFLQNTWESCHCLNWSLNQGLLNRGYAILLLFHTPTTLLKEKEGKKKKKKNQVKPKPKMCSQLYPNSQRWKAWLAKIRVLSFVISLCELRLHVSSSK